MPAPLVLNVAAALLAGVPASTGDTATVSNTTVNRTGTVATGYLVLTERGRLAPLPLTGNHPWTVQRAQRRGRIVRASISTPGHLWQAEVRYRADGGAATATVRVRLIAR